jgi:hypothetical protein
MLSWDITSFDDSSCSMFGEGFLETDFLIFVGLITFRYEYKFQNYNLLIATIATISIIRFNRYNQFLFIMYFPKSKTY